MWRMRRDDATSGNPGRRRGIGRPFAKDEQGRTLLEREMFRRGGVGVTELAKAAGVDKGTVSRAASGNPVKFETQIQLLEALRAWDVDPRADALLKGDLPWDEEEDS